MIMANYIVSPNPHIHAPVSTKKLKTGSVGSNAWKGISAKAVFKCPAGKVKAYKKLFKKCGAPAKAKWQ